MRRLQALAVAVVVGLWLALAPGCGTVPGGPCGFGTCAGCCTAFGQCNPGDQPNACGLFSADCRSCAGGGCFLGTCGTPLCGPANCAGCCDAEGRCSSGVAPQECGRGGSACAPCGFASCVAGRCDVGPGGGGGAGGGTPGGGGGGSGGGVPIIDCGSGALADHLLISEVRAFPTPAEAVEIYNPTSAAVDLTDYRLYSASFLPSDGGAGCHYWAHDGGTCAVAYNDFDLQFPLGASIGPGQAKVIALTSAAAFCGGACLGLRPDFEVPPLDGGDDSVPDMRGMWDLNPVIFQNRGFLADNTEDLVLYRWDGLGPSKVIDIDYFLWGQSLLVRSDKSGVVGYLPDVPSSQQVPFLGPTNTQVDFQRACFNERGERVMGGNGLTGHDETSENLGANWIFAAPSFGSKTPGSVP